MNISSGQRYLFFCNIIQSLLIIDILVLKDELGFETFEIILKEIISLIRQSVRIDDYILRWNRDQFLVMYHKQPNLIQEL